MMFIALTILTLGLAAPQEAGVGSKAPSMAQELMLELSREPRIVGTRGYDRALDLVGSALEQAGLAPQRRVRKSGRVIPLRSDALFFEDGTQAEPFAGVRERWDPTAVPTMPRPMAFDHNPESADVRGPVIQVGGGLAADFDRVAGLGVDLKGAVLLASLELVPAERKTTVREIAERAAAAGATGLLIAPSASDAAGSMRTLYVQENTVGESPLALPTAPIRVIEAEALQSRLRTKRVRGKDGKAVPIRLGPGPVEASITMDCPLVELDGVAELVVTRGGGEGQPARSHQISLVDLCDRPLGGTFEVTAELLSLMKGYDEEARKLSASIAPEHGAVSRRTEYVFGPFLLASSPPLLMPAALEPSARTTMVPGRFQRPGSVMEYFGASFGSRSDAAARFLAYESEVRNFRGDAPEADPSWKALAANAEAAAAALISPR